MHGTWRPRPAPDAHASLLKLPPLDYFLCRDPGAGFALLPG